MKQWYYARDGEQMGPVRENDLIALLRNEELPADTLIWSEGMSEWVSAKNARLFYAPPTATLQDTEGALSDDLTRSNISREDPPLSNATPNVIDTSTPEQNDVVRVGIGRGAYFGLLILLGIISGLLGASGSFGEGVSFILVIPGLILGGMRYKSIGYSPWLILLAIIPLVNLVVGYQCLALPPGYAQTKQADRVMKIVSGVYILVILLIVLAIAIPALV
jgi:uncharacterized membrane protein YhaH (DUF805 family)